MKKLSKVTMLLLTALLGFSLLLASCNANEASFDKTTVLQSQSSFVPEPSATIQTSCVHDYLTEETEPTCTASGMMLLTCTKCGESHEELVSPPINHSGIGKCTMCNENISDILGRQIKEANI